MIRCNSNCNGNNGDNIDNNNNINNDNSDNDNDDNENDDNKAEIARPTFASRAKSDALDAEPSSDNCFSCSPAFDPLFIGWKQNQTLCGIGQ